MTKYIWHTQEDDKVRPWHASRDGKVFDSNKPPKGGNPGDAPNCRCWAEPIEKENYPDSLYDRNKTGTVSREFESSNNPVAIGHDIKGGYSYGDYQIATNNGTFDDFMKYLKKNPNYDDYYEYLQEAGGSEAAKIKERKFELAWHNIANDDRFRQAQHNFMVDKKYKPVIRLTRDIKGLDLDSRHPVVKEVIFSTAVQHGEGGAADILHEAFGKDASSISDKDMIKQIYHIRALTNKKFKSSPPAMQKGIIKRFQREADKILKQMGY